MTSREHPCMGGVREAVSAWWEEAVGPRALFSLQGQRAQLVSELSEKEGRQAQPAEGCGRAGTVHGQWGGRPLGHNRTGPRATFSSRV